MDKEQSVKKLMDYQQKNLHDGRDDNDCDTNMGTIPTNLGNARHPRPTNACYTEAEQINTDMINTELFLQLLHFELGVPRRNV